MKELGQSKGYTLVHCERTGANAFFVANEASSPGLSAAADRRNLSSAELPGKGPASRPDPARVMIDPFARTTPFLPDRHWLMASPPRLSRVRRPIWL